MGKILNQLPQLQVNGANSERDPPLQEIKSVKDNQFTDKQGNLMIGYKVALSKTNRQLVLNYILVDN